MGIGIAIIYLPLYGVLSVVSLIIGIKIQSVESKNEYAAKPRIYVLLGIIFSLFTSLMLIWMVPVHGNTDWNASFTQLGLTLLAPIAFGIIFYLFSFIFSNKINYQIRCFSSGNFYSIIALPWVSLFVAANYSVVVNYPAYSRLCKNAKIEILKEDVGPAKSIALIPDKFVQVPKRRQSEYHSAGKYLLNNYQLDFVETSKEEGNDNEVSKPAFEHWTISGERVLRGTPGTQYLSVNVNDLSAEYIIIPEQIYLPKEKKQGIGGSRIQIKRTSDNILIAYAEYYWDNKNFKACPGEAHKSGFIFTFISNSLNISRVPPFGGKG